MKTFELSERDFPGADGSPSLMDLVAWANTLIVRQKDKIKKTVRFMFCKKLKD
jgi:hypothetical protein